MGVRRNLYQSKHRFQAHRKFQLFPYDLVSLILRLVFCVAVFVTTIRVFCLFMEQRSCLQQGMLMNFLCITSFWGPLVGLVVASGATKSHPWVHEHLFCGWSVRSWELWTPHQSPDKVSSSQLIWLHLFLEAWCWCMRTLQGKLQTRKFSFLFLYPSAPCSLDSFQVAKLIVSISFCFM